MSGYLWAITATALALAAATIAFYRSIVAPAVVWMGAWSGLLLLAAVLGQNYIYAPSALIAALAAIAAFPVGAAVTAIVPARVSRDPRGLAVLYDKSVLIQGMCALFGVGGAVYLSVYYGQSLLSVRSVEQLLTGASSVAAAIYRGEASMPAVAKLAFAVLQVGFLVSGVAVAARHPRAWMMFAALCVAMILWPLVTTQRSFLFVPITFWVGSFAATMIFLRRDAVLSRPKVLLAGGAALIALASLVVALQTVRMGARTGLGPVLDHMRPWIAGYLPAFSGWFERWDGSANGGASFLGGLIALVTGGVEQAAGAERGLTMVPIGAGDYSNAPTALPLFFGSFGLLGGVAAIALFGAICQLVYRSCRAGSPIACVLMGAVLGAIIWTPNAWFFGYGSRVFAIVVLAVAVWLAGKVLFASANAMQAFDPPRPTPALPKATGGVAVPVRRANPF